MDRLIPVINKLQDVFTKVGAPPIELPQLVVVGSQSSGKSSVLENIVGRDFLPRGNTIVTRRPLIIQLINNLNHEEEEGEPEEYGQFLHMEKHKLTDFSKIRKEIERETDRVGGTNKGISNQPIRLSIYSPKVLNLTLVDLPGVTKVPVGDQPSDIELQTKALVFEFISNPNAIIIAVTPGNIDLANSEALKMAQEVDPHGVRTLAVITKIDLMDRGTDAMEVLTGKVIDLHLGFVGVVNRSQHDINTAKSIQDALKDEKAFFQTHSVYRPISSRCGTHYLTKRLNTILLTQIQQCLPEMRMKIGAAINETRQELESYGEPNKERPQQLGPLLLMLISKYASNFCDALEGRSPDISITQLYGGARISFVFHDVFATEVEHINPYDVLSDQDIRTAIRNATGPRPSLFIPEVAFELLVKRQIERLLSPSLQCVDMVFDELKRVSAQAESLSPELVRFPVLKERCLVVVRNLLKKHITPTKDMITNLINLELAYINTNHPDFIGGSNAVACLMESFPQEDVEEQIKKETAKAGSVNGMSAQPRTKTQANERAASSSTKVTAKTQKEVDSDDDRHPFATEDDVGDDDEHDMHNQEASGGFMSIFWGKNKQGKETHTRNSMDYPSERSAQVTYETPTRLDTSAPDLSMYSTFAPDNPTERELIETEIIKSLLTSYFAIVKKNIRDTVPKAIMHFCVNTCKDSIQSELVSELYKEELLQELLKEADDISLKRESCTEVLSVMNQALDVVNQVNDFCDP